MIKQTIRNLIGNVQREARIKLLEMRVDMLVASIKLIRNTIVDELKRQEWSGEELRGQPLDYVLLSFQSWSESVPHFMGRIAALEEELKQVKANKPRMNDVTREEINQARSIINEYRRDYQTLVDALPPNLVIKHSGNLVHVVKELVAALEITADDLQEERNKRRELSEELKNLHHSLESDNDIKVN